MRTVFGPVLACLLVGLLLWAHAAQAQVKIGALYPFSDILAPLGEESFRGLELAVDERNQAGGIKGQRIEIVKGDAATPNQAVIEARRLTSVEKVPVIFGTQGSSLALAATQVTELAGVTYFEMGATADQITERDFKNLYRINPTGRDYGSETVDALLEVVAPALKLDTKTLKVAILHEDSLHGQTVAGAQVARARERGLRLIEVLSYAAKSEDLTPLILRLKSLDTDVVLQTSYQQDTVLFLRQMKEQGLALKAIIGAGGGYSFKSTARAVGVDTIDGVFDVDVTQYETNLVNAPGMARFIVEYRKKYGMPPRSGHSLAHYMGARVFLDIMAAAKDFSGPSIREQAQKTDIPEGATPTGWGVKFDDKGQNERATPYLAQWQNGRLITVHPPQMATAPIKAPHTK